MILIFLIQARLMILPFKMFHVTSNDLVTFQPLQSPSSYGTNYVTELFEVV